jgi:cysteine desulfurase
MLEPVRYFDNGATTRIDPRVLEEMMPWLREDFGNASSMHIWGRKAMAAVDEARERCATLIGAEDPEEIFFTSGATESNNWVLQRCGSFAASPFEHSSVRALVEELPEGHRLPNSGWSVGTPEQSVDLISVMAVNSEMGCIVSRPKFSGLVHSDVTQGAGKVPISLEGIDYASFSSHKMSGPKGVGGLYMKSGRELEPLIYGGGQERGLRSGTLNVSGIIGFGAAAKLAHDDFESNRAHVSELRNIVKQELAQVPDVRCNDHVDQSPFTLSLSFYKLVGETLVIEMDARGWAISAGSACSSGSQTVSPVLVSLGITDDWARGTVRMSFSKWNTKESAAAMAKDLAECARRLQSLN